MKKFVYFCIIFLLLMLPVIRVNAEIDPLFDVGCAPTETCHIKPEKITRILKGGQSETHGAVHFDLTGHQWDYTQIWDGIVKPLNNVYHYGTDLLTNFGSQIQDASFTDLTPAALQTQIQHDVQPKRFCVTSRLCVYHPVEGLRQFITSETFCTVDPPNRKELIEGTRRLASYATNYTIGTDYRLPDTVVKKEAPLGCGVPMDAGRIMDENPITTQKQNQYDNAVTPWSFPIPGWMVEGPYPCGKDNRQTCWNAHATTTAIEKGSAENSMAASLAGISFTVTEQDLKPFAYPSDAAKTELTKIGGLWNTYRNEFFDPAFKSPLDAIYQNQLWEVTINGFKNPYTADTLQSMNARQENAQLFGNLSIIPAALQHVFFPGISNTLSWLNPNYQPPGGITPPGGSGASGASGGSGASGASGGSGASGASGGSGASGASGGSGASGATGATGPTGAPGTLNCDVNASPAPVPGLNSDAGKSYADNMWGSTCNSGTSNAWVPCENDVIARAQKSCIDPIFALAIWIHESGASNYICGEQFNNGIKVQDFGVNLTSIAENFSAQLDSFLRLSDAYAAKCPGKTMQDFVSLFWFGDSCYALEPAETQKKIDDYITELNGIYSIISPGKSLPSWPKGSCSN